MRAVLGLLFILCLSTSVQADALGAADQAALDATRTRFIQALKDQDFDIIVSVIPPKLVAEIAGTAGVSAEELLKALPKVLEQSMKQVAFTSAEITTENLDATRVVAGGEEYFWGFAPSTFEMKISGRNFKATGHTLALLDAGEWYLIRTSETDKVTLMRKIYPFFEAVEFPAEAVTTID